MLARRRFLETTPSRVASRDKPRLESERELEGPALADELSSMGSEYTGPGPALCNDYKDTFVLPGSDAADEASTNSMSTDAPRTRVPCLGVSRL